MGSGPSGSITLHISFGLFTADLGNRELRKHGIRVRLQEKPFQVLVATSSRRTRDP